MASSKSLLKLHICYPMAAPPPPPQWLLLMRVSFPPCTCNVLLKWGALHYTSARAQRATVYTAVRSRALRPPLARRERGAPFCSASFCMSSSPAFHQINEDLIIKRYRDASVRTWFTYEPADTQWLFFRILLYLKFELVRSANMRSDAVDKSSQGGWEHFWKFHTNAFLFLALPNSIIFVKLCNTQRSFLIEILM